MHLVIEALGNTRGGGWVILNDMLAAFSNDDRLTKVTVFTSPSEHQLFLHSKITRIVKVRESKHYVSRLLWLENIFGRKARSIEADVVLFINGLGRYKGKHINYIQQPLFFDHRASASLKMTHQVRLRFLEKLSRDSCRRASRVFVQGSWMQKRMKEDWLITPDIVRSPPPMNFHFKSLKKEIQVLWIGNELPYKRRFFFQDATRSLKIERVEICSSESKLSRDEILKLLRRSKVLAMTSTTESLGLPLIEAMAMGTVVLAPNCAYAKDICKDAACYYETNSPTDFKNKLCKLIDDIEQRKQYISKGKVRVKYLADISENYKILRDTICE